MRAAIPSADLCCEVRLNAGTLWETFIADSVLWSDMCNWLEKVIPKLED